MYIFYCSYPNTPVVVRAVLCEEVARSATASYTMILLTV